MNGIPARWTTGWESFADSGENMHDWCEFYVEPCGWLPADPDMAVNILNYADEELTTGQQKRLTDWLFGNMDSYRLTVNSDYGQPLYPAKTDFRSETVDFQRGEVESDGKNLYFDTWDYKMRIRPIDSAKAEALRQQFVPEPVILPAKTPAPAPTPTPSAAPALQPSPTPEPAATPQPKQTPEPLRGPDPIVETGSTTPSEALDNKTTPAR